MPPKGFWAVATVAMRRTVRANGVVKRALRITWERWQRQRGAVEVEGFGGASACGLESAGIFSPQRLVPAAD